MRKDRTYILKVDEALYEYDRFDYLVAAIRKHMLYLDTKICDYKIELSSINKKEVKNG